MSAYNEGLKAGTDKFVSLSIQAMKTLKRKGKPNVLKDFVKCLGLTRPDSQKFFFSIRHCFKSFFLK
jgi:hypothetical protein